MSALGFGEDQKVQPIGELFKKKLIVSKFLLYYGLRLYSKRMVNGKGQIKMYTVIIQARDDIQNI